MRDKVCARVHWFPAQNSMPKASVTTLGGTYRSRGRGTAHPRSPSRTLLICCFRFDNHEPLVTPILETTGSGP